MNRELLNEETQVIPQDAIKTGHIPSHHGKKKSKLLKVLAQLQPA